MKRNTTCIFKNMCLEMDFLFSFFKIKLGVPIKNNRTKFYFKKNEFTDIDEGEVFLLKHIKQVFL